MTTNAEILVKLEAMHSDIQEIKRTEAARVEREKQLREDVNELQDTVNGNGKTGLKTQVAVIEASLNRLTLTLGVIGGPLLASMIGLIVLILTHQLPGFNP